MRTYLRNRAIYASIAAAFICFAIVIHLGSALLGRSLIRAAHLGTAIEYSKTHIDLLRPVITGFNATATPTALELPVWQALVGCVFKLMHSTWDGWGNLVSLALFAPSIIPFFLLARFYVGEEAAWWSVILFLAQPLIICYSGLAGTDGWCFTLAIWFLFAAFKVIHEGTIVWWILTAVVGSLSAVSKLPFFISVALSSIFLLFLHKRKSARAWLLLGSSGIMAAMVFALWSAHTDQLAAQAEFPFTELRLSKSKWLEYWYFGDLNFRLRLSPWLRGSWRLVHSTLGSLPFAVVLVATILGRGNRMPKVWLTSCVLTTLVFSNLVLAHWHYFLMYSPAVAMLCGSTLSRYVQSTAVERCPYATKLGLMSACVFLSTLQGLLAMRSSLEHDPFTCQMASIIRQNTDPNDKLIVHNYHLIWGGEVLFRAERTGLVVSCLKGGPLSPSPKGLYDILENRADFERLKALGYNKLVLISESPLQYGTVVSSPTGSGGLRKRGLYPATISPDIDTWATQYVSDDIIIKRIP